MKCFIFPFLLLVSRAAFAQYPPPAGQPGTTAMHRDSSAFIGWATTCTVTRGLQDISDPSLGFASVGEPSMAIGKTAGVVSLGDGGTATLTFSQPIFNGPGWDFAVFENGFEEFLELAFVEVSSDGENFFRFPASSLTDTLEQIDNNGGVKATRINNLAGKYVVNFGTPFDLEELKDIPGLDINKVTHVRIIDVVGSLNDAYATRDTAGRKINEPWPTPFPSGGFDLEAVGVIHTTLVSGIAKDDTGKFRVYPNPVRDKIFIQAPTEITAVSIMDITGKKYLDKPVIQQGNKILQLEIPAIPAGFYYLVISANGTVHTTQLVISE